MIARHLIPAMACILMVAVVPQHANAHRKVVRPPGATHPLVSETIIEDSSGHALETFAAALRRARNHAGQARILVWGASHTAADLWTGTLRRGLQALYGDAGHGFVLPGRPWAYYRQSDVNLASSDGWFTDRVDKADARPDGLYGIAGASVSSASAADWSRAATTRENPMGRKVSRIEAWYLKQPGGGAFDIRIDRKKPVRISTSADQREAGYQVFDLPDGPHQVEIRPAGNGEVRMFGLVLERRVPGVVVDTLGIPGTRAEHMLKWDQEILAQQVARRRPDLVILAYGTNEAGDDDVPIESYEIMLREVMQRVKTVAAGASCLLIGPTDRPLQLPSGAFGPRPRRAQVTDVQRRVSADIGCAFFDTAAFMGGEGGMVNWVKAQTPLGSRDHVHLTPISYEIMGRTILAELLRLAAEGSRKIP
jgi:lysophospholipase L1-like esterase